MLESFSFTTVKLAMVQGVIDERVKELTDEHVRLFLASVIRSVLTGLKFL